MDSDIFQNKELLEKLRTLTLERLKVMPENTELAIGADRYSKDDLIHHVSDADELGRQIMASQLEFLQDLASGEIYKDDHFDHPSQA